MSKTVKVSIIRRGAMCAIPVPFDPKAVFGKVRAPVKVTLKGYTFRSTIARMNGVTFIPLRKSNKEAAGVESGEHVSVRIAADTQARVVEVPSDLAKALTTKPGLRKKWSELSYTRRRESVESILAAKRPDTRQRRIARIIESVDGKASCPACETFATDIDIHGPAQLRRIVEKLQAAVGQRRLRSISLWQAPICVHDVFAVESGEVRTIRAHTLPQGIASQHVLEKSDFTYVGEFDDPEDGIVRRYERAVGSGDGDG